MWKRKVFGFFTRSNIAIRSKTAQLVYAANQGSLKSLKSAYYCGADVNGLIASSETGTAYTALYAASRNGHSALVSFLISLPEINVNLGDSENETPLFAAIERGHIDVVQLLLSVPHTDLNLERKDGCFPLFIAVQKKRREILQLLLARPDLDINKRFLGGYTGIILSALHGDAESTSALLGRNDIDVDVTTLHGDTALRIARYKSYDDVVRLLSRT